jgi:hypothetical protein
MQVAVACSARCCRHVGVIAHTGAGHLCCEAFEHPLNQVVLAPAYCLGNGVNSALTLENVHDNNTVVVPEPNGYSLRKSAEVVERAARGTRISRSGDRGW